MSAPDIKVDHIKKRGGIKNNNLITPKISINVGCLVDIPTGMPMIGNKGETIINGGVGPLMAVIGRGNVFKSTFLHYLTLQAADRMAATVYPTINTFDTEVNMTHEGLSRLSRHYLRLAALHGDENGILYGEDPLWKVTDKSLNTGENWYNTTKKQIIEKGNDKSNVIEYTAFKDPYSGKTLKGLIPDLIQVDSLSELEGDETVNMVDNNGIGDQKVNTLFMKQNLFKTRVTADLPRLASSKGMYFLMTAQVKDDNINMKTGPMAHLPPPKKLPHMKADEKIVGVSTKFFFLFNAVFQATNAKNLMNQTTKLPEYPRYSEDTHGQDLNEVNIKMLRCKTGTSGYNLKILISQMDGVLPSLTELHHIKSHKRYGLLGNDRTYQVALLPEVNLARATVRTKIDENPKLRRAINIISEMLQLEMFHPQYLRMYDIKCTPEELYNDIKTMGYDWDKLLDTRGWWAIDQYSKHLEPYLHTLDLLKIRKGLYHPYWYPKDGITNPAIKK